MMRWGRCRKQKSGRGSDGVGARGGGVDPEVLRSRFGLIFFGGGWRILGELLTHSSANSSASSSARFLALFLQGFRPTPPPKNEVTPKTHAQNHAQNSRPTSPWRTFRIFFIFSARGGGRGSPRPPGGGGGRFFIENPRGGGCPGGEGAEGPGGCLRRIGDFSGGG